MTTPEKPDADPPKPTLHLMRPPFTAEKMAEMWRHLTGKEPTPENMEEFRRSAERMAAKDAAKKAADGAAKKDANSGEKP